MPPIRKSLLNMSRRNARKLKEKERTNNLTRKLRDFIKTKEAQLAQLKKLRNNQESVDEEYSKLQARLNALKRKSPKKTNSSSNFVEVTSKNLIGYKKNNGRSTTLKNRIKRMTKKASKALTRK